MRLCIVGGGGFRTPTVWEALLRDRGTPRVTEVVLYDVDPQRLGVIEAILAQLAQPFPDPPALRVTTDLETALTGADFVFAAIRVGGVEGRCLDEHIALDLGVLGQETTGVGGLAYALRTLPVMLDLANTMARVAPNAYLLNFTNPAGIITEALSAVLGDRVVGICDTPASMGRAVARALGRPTSGLELDYVGLNHLGWLRRVLVDGQDVLPDLLASDALADTEEAELFGVDWLRRFGCLPNEYLYYYYRNREAVAALTAASATRGDFLRQTQDAFYAAAHTDPDPAGLWRAVGAHREANYMAESRGAQQGAGTRVVSAVDDAAALADQGYAGVALAVMAAIARGEPSTMILNVPNAGTIHALPDDAVVEVSCRVDADGPHPLALAQQPDLHQLGLMASVKHVERLVIRAVLNHDRNLAEVAFGIHPLVNSTGVAASLLDGYLAAHPGLAATLSPR